MKYEISIEGSQKNIIRLNKALQNLGPSFEKLPKRHEHDGDRARMILIEHDPQMLHRKLEQVSDTIRLLETELEIRVRNLAYSEPVVGGTGSEKPYELTPAITVIPWHPSLPERRDFGTIILDSQHTFGTGKHPTTRLCVTIMEQLTGSGSRQSGLLEKQVLDFGCGSGLLALAAADMGAAWTLGIEIDSKAVEAARRNVWLNRLSSRITVRRGSWEMVQESFDLILANLVPIALLKSASSFSQHLKNHGEAVVSGFGIKQAPEMEEHLRKTGLKVIQRFNLEGWCALLLKRQDNATDPDHFLS